MTLMRVSQGVTCAITILMYKVGTPNTLFLAVVRWTPIILIVVPYQTPGLPRA